MNYSVSIHERFKQARTSNASLLKFRASYTRTGTEHALRLFNLLVCYSLETKVITVSTACYEGAGYNRTGVLTGSDLDFSFSTFVYIRFIA